jgi:hypothetical protein
LPAIVTAAIALTWTPLSAWAAIAALRGIWTPTCDWWFGIGTFLAMPMAGGALAAAAGVALGLLVGPRPRLGTIVPIVFALGLAGMGLAAFYSAPPVFSYTPLLGYFPGNLYDEQIEITGALGWARLEALLWVGATLAAVAASIDASTLRWRATNIVGLFRFSAGGGRRERRPVMTRNISYALLGVTLGIAAFSLHHMSGRLGYAIEAEDVQTALQGRCETEHFVIHYAKTDAIQQDLKLIAEDHELRFAQVTAALGITTTKKIHSYYFADAEQKSRWMGARDVEMAKPWRREIYLDHRAFPHSALRHEIAHIIAGEFGDRWFRVSARHVAGLPLLINPGLIEGLAVAADWPGGYERDLTPHQATRAMQELGFTPSIDALLSLSFLSLSSARSYTTAGSFVRFLLDTFGPAALRVLYRNGGDFREAYGESASLLQAQWRQMISTISLRSDEIEATRERFREPGVFDRPCPHAVANRRARAIEAVRQGNRVRGVKLLRRVCDDAPMEPRYRLELGDVLIRGDAGEAREALELWNRVAQSRFVTSSLRAEALERQAGIAATDAAWERARALVNAALELPIGDGQRRQLEAKRFALVHQGLSAFALRGYFFPQRLHPGDPLQWAMWAVALDPSLGLAWYLRGLRRGDSRLWSEMTDDLARAIRLGLPSPSFIRNAARRLAVAAYRAGDAGQLLFAIATLSRPEMTETDKLLAKDWIQRLRFASSGHLGD